MKTLAVLGTSGFVGVRLVEMLHLGGRAKVRPILARPASLAPLARFDLECRLADTANLASLTSAMTGCETLVHLATGNPETIRALTSVVYEAAAFAGVRRLIYMSSASVHGQAPAPGTTETTPLPRRHQFPYNAAKAWAENRLRQARASGTVELVILRPGIVWGPRSRWVIDTVRALRDGTFGWLDGGRAVINPIYVDNLVHAVECACAAPVDGETFLLNDPQPQNWREFFTPWIEACGLSPDKIPAAAPHVPARGLAARFERARVHPWTQRVAPKIPGAVKRTLKAVVSSLKEPITPDSLSINLERNTAPAPLSEEMTALQRCAWRFPTTHAETRLGWKPVVDWPTAVERTRGWLRFAELIG